VAKQGKYTREGHRILSKIRNFGETVLENQSAKSHTNLLGMVSKSFYEQTRTRRKGFNDWREKVLQNQTKPLLPMPPTSDSFMQTVLKNQTHKIH
jgi:hypothetical protein